MSIEVEWARMTAPDLREIAARKGALAILPAGSLEQHGPHLPVITDTASASAASIAAARLVVEGADPVPVAVLPGLWLGLSEPRSASTMPLIARSSKASCDRFARWALPAC
jgi:creatinine amidohydrolase